MHRLIQAGHGTVRLEPSGTKSPVQNFKKVILIGGLYLPSVPLPLSFSLVLLDSFQKKNMNSK